MRRRNFIVGLTCTTAAWPINAARAQQPERMRHIGVLMNYAADDPQGQARFRLFVQELQRLGWADGRTAQFDVRWAADDPARFRQFASELLANSPDVVLAAASPSVAALQQASRSVPIVFTSVADPVGAGFVESLARPGGNTTGFSLSNTLLPANGSNCLEKSRPA